MADLAPETLSAIDDLMRRINVDIRTWVEDRLAEQRDVVNDLTVAQNGIRLLGGSVEIVPRVQALRFVGMGVQWDASDQSGVISAPGVEHGIVGLEWEFAPPLVMNPPPVTPPPPGTPVPPPADGSYGTLEIPFPAEILGATIKCDAIVEATFRVQVAPETMWPNFGLVGPPDPLGGTAPGLVLTDILAPLTKVNTEEWNIHYLERGDAVRVTLIEADILTSPILFTIAVRRLPGYEGGLGSEIIEDGAGSVLVDLDGNVIVVRR